LKDRTRQAASRAKTKFRKRRGYEPNPMRKGIDDTIPTGGAFSRGVLKFTQHQPLSKGGKDGSAYPLIKGGSRGEPRKPSIFQKKSKAVDRGGVKKKTGLPCTRKSKFSNIGV